MDKWIEILSTLGRNPLRTILTALGVFWGIFMLVILMGAGTGLENGILTSFAGFDMNSMYIWPQKTTIPYKGLKPGRMYNFKNADVAVLKADVPELKYICPRLQLGGFGQENNVGRNNKVGNYSVFGDYPEFAHIQKLKITEGRFLNYADLKDLRKICIIGQKVAEELYQPGEEVIGSYIKIQGVYFKVAGIFNTSNQGQEGLQDLTTLFIPFTTFQRAFNQGDMLHWFALSVKPGYDSYTVEEKVKKSLMAQHNIHPDDLRSVGSFNAAMESAKFSRLFGGIKAIIFIVGLGTLFAGGVGVMNIMLISVAERTKEIGIRKAMGATPYDIISMIVAEAVLLSLTAGFVGLALGIALLDGVDSIVSNAPASAEGGPTMFRQPEISASIAIASVFILVVIGTLAGLYPAQRAVRIDPIQALRTE